MYDEYFKPIIEARKADPMVDLNFGGLSTSKTPLDEKQEILIKIGVYYKMYPGRGFNDMLHDTNILPCIHDQETLSRLDEFIHGETIKRMKNALGDKFYDVTGLEFTNKVWQTRLENLTEQDLIIAFNQDAYIKIQMGAPIMNWMEFQSLMAGKDPPIEGQESINKSDPSTYSSYLIPNQVIQDSKKLNIEEMKKKISLI